MKTFLIVDDEAHGRELLSVLLRRLKPDCHILEADSVDQAVKLYLNHKPDLVFLDVEMPKKNGFEFIHELLQIEVHPRVVFVTAFNQYAIQAIKASALDYLLKPVNEDDLQLSLNRINSLKEEQVEQQKMLDLLSHVKHTPRLKLNTRVGFEIIRPQDILFCEADGNYTNVCLTNGKKHTTSTTLGVVEEQLPHDQFYRIARSVVINLDYLASVNRKEKLCRLQFDDTAIDLPLSLNRVQELSNIFSI